VVIQRGCISPSIVISSGVRRSSQEVGGVVGRVVRDSNSEKVGVYVTLDCDWLRSLQEFAGVRRSS